jgi:hypothetical protein
MDHGHAFGLALQSAFEGFKALLAEAVGMNVWHFQAKINASSAPRPLREFCESSTRTLIERMEPRHILCFGDPAYRPACFGQGETMSDEGATIKCRYQGGIKVWGVPHLTGSYTRFEAMFCTPTVVAAIARDLGFTKRAAY